MGVRLLVNGLEFLDVVSGDDIFEIAEGGSLRETTEVSPLVVARDAVVTSLLQDLGCQVQSDT